MHVPIVFHLLEEIIKSNNYLNYGKFNDIEKL